MFPLYALILTGAVSGMGGALLIQSSAGAFPTPSRRRGAWILGAGLAAGLLLGGLAARLFIAPLPAPPHAAALTVRGPS